jgi:hypothetical protein
LLEPWIDARRCICVIRFEDVPRNDHVIRDSLPRVAEAIRPIFQHLNRADEEDPDQDKPAADQAHREAATATITRPVRLRKRHRRVLEGGPAPSSQRRRFRHSVRRRSDGCRRRRRRRRRRAVGDLEHAIAAGTLHLLLAMFRRQRKTPVAVGTDDRIEHGSFPMINWMKLALIA